MDQVGADHQLTAPGINQASETASGTIVTLQDNSVSSTTGSDAAQQATSGTTHCDDDCHYCSGPETD
ncbi:hypothetical protein ASF98_03575 [Arthrobacter sp. Leaf337]|nr:hypothetical protein ASF98_03575 [Arthrobacter sp. Leaf337]